jgi:hypothetical protein
MKTMQNEFLDYMLSVYREFIITETENADYVAILCGGTKDMAKKQKLILVYRFVLSTCQVVIIRVQ